MNANVFSHVYVHIQFGIVACVKNSDQSLLIESAYRDDHYFTFDDCNRCAVIIFLRTYRQERHSQLSISAGCDHVATNN